MTSRPTLLSTRSWPDLVFHVLAHVAATAHLPASLYDPTYVAYAEQQLGPSAQRPLCEDAVVLGQVLPTHEQLARAQLLAWLFDEVDQAAVLADQDLVALEAAELTRPGLLAPLVALGPAVEVLRCAALLEHQAHAKLPELKADRLVRSTAWAEVTEVAPRLAACDLLLVRSLRLRGRLFGDEIWVGTPAPELALAADHVVWQAAHEATVKEVSETAHHPVAERQVERIAVVLLAERAIAAGLGDGHGRWLSHFGASGPRTDRGGLGDAGLAVLAACHRGS